MLFSSLFLCWNVCCSFAIRHTSNLAHIYDTSPLFLSSFLVCDSLSLLSLPICLRFLSSFPPLLFVHFCLFSSVFRFRALFVPFFCILCTCFYSFFVCAFFLTFLALCLFATSLFRNLSHAHAYTGALAHKHAHACTHLHKCTLFFGSEVKVQTHKYELLGAAFSLGWLTSGAL